MKKKTWIKLIQIFLQEQAVFFLLTISGLIIFYIVFYLYQLEMEAYWYATGLSLLFFVIILMVRFSRYSYQHKIRQQILSSIEFNWHQLQFSESLIESDYQEMLQTLGKRCVELSTQLKNETQESIAYYTTWVHQIKTPISVMQMMLQSEDIEEHRALSVELFRIEQYVEMVLNYIRLGSSHNDFVFQEYNLNTLVRQSIHKYAAQFVHRKLQLIYEPMDIMVLTDEKWTIFIIEQLLSNAIKYTYQGSVKICVTEDRKLTVADTGIGIAPEDLPQIFEKGFTGYNGRADKKATGLGLYLCKQAAEKLGISITVQSEPGVGTVFTLDLAKKKLEVE